MVYTCDIIQQKDITNNNQYYGGKKNSGICIYYNEQSWEYIC